MMYLKNVSYPDRLLDLKWIFTKIEFLLFLQISLPNSLRICLQNKPKWQVSLISEALFESVRVVNTL